MEQLKQIFVKHKNVCNAAEILGEENVHLSNTICSSLPFIIWGTQNIKPSTKFLIFNDKETAAYLYNDLINIAGENSSVYFFPSIYKRSIHTTQKDKANLILRSEALAHLANRDKKSIIISYPEAITEKVTPIDIFQKNTIEIKTREKYSIDFIVEMLEELGFTRSDFVYEAGEYSVRGSIIDIFSFANNHPYRIDFFGDDVNSIRTFDIETQLSIQKLQAITVIPENNTDESISIFEFLPSSTSLWIDSSVQIAETLAKITKLIDDNDIVGKDDFLEALDKFKWVEFGGTSRSREKEVVEFNVSPQPNFNKNFNLLIENLQDYQTQGYTHYILSDNPKQLERLKDILEDKETNLYFTPVSKTVHTGFIDHDLKICIYTDHQIFGRFHKYNLRSKHPREGKAAQLAKQINELQIDDYVIHQDHGIGKFAGLQKIKKGNTTQEAIKLLYNNNDQLYVGLHSLHKISKYRGKESTPPKINKLGTGVWLKLKTKAKGKIKDIAKDLISLYAKRKTTEGHNFAPDSYLQQELESSFIYEDTPDQTQATQLVKKAMETKFPMDCLVCGDVGFGKTEIAIRAAFKAVADSKQVAVLVPTTVLALQHYKTFTRRLKRFPCNIEYVSRLRQSKDIRKAIEGVKTGQVDILIGTHRIVGKDIKFKDLGLLIVDEEQKFGVSIKEKLKNLKANVDTLTLTATPIPRTLQFSLMGIRDLSIMKTPPPNRYPIVTELHLFNENIIKEAIAYEIERGGQVYFVHNRVQNIEEIQAMLNRILPNVSTIVAHGQMEGRQLEKTILDFIEGQYDVLICTTIIESGVDIPNVNTIIINQAQNFGLSDLHQLRGRVGRTNKKAFCYLLSPPVTVLTPEAQRRLKTIEEFSELGSGFNIALQDLDIRGAGNLLGAEQNGYITEIGYETYHKILDEAIDELKETEFKDLYEDTEKEDKKYVKDCQIDTDLEILFPDTYIESVSERIKLYRQLDNTETQEALSNFENSLKDRFGEIPPQTIELLNIVKLRWAAEKLAVDRIIIKNKKMLNFFVANKNSPFYQSNLFQEVLTFIQKNSKTCSLKENNKGRLTLSIKNINSVSKAIEVLNKITIPS